MHGFSAAAALLKDALSPLSDAHYHGVGVAVLAIVFAWSSAAKIHRPLLAAMALVDFGIVRKVRRWHGTALGVGEGVLAIALVSGLAADASLTAATILLWFFVAMIAGQLLTGRTFACFCFGDADSVLSRWTLARTGALAVLAMLLAAFAPLHANTARELPLPALQWITAAALVGSAVLAYQSVRLMRGSTGRLEGAGA